MKKLFALAVVALITAPAGAHSVRTSDGFEVEPTHTEVVSRSSTLRTDWGDKMFVLPYGSASSL